MVYTFGPNEPCLRRCRAIVPVFVRVVKETTSKGVEVLAGHQDVVHPLMGWWQFTNRTAEALVLLYDQGFTVEAAPLMRNLMGHAYAMNWLADNGRPAVRALTAYWQDHQRKLAANIDATWNLPEPVEVAPREPLVFTDETDEKVHRKLVGEWPTSTTWSAPMGQPTCIPSTVTSLRTHTPLLPLPTPTWSSTTEG
jgi:hypothetical protein